MFIFTKERTFGIIVSSIKEMIILSNLKAEEYKSFEQIKKIRKDGTEYWNARELSEVLQYKKWENFSKVIDRAKLECNNSGFEVQDHFLRSGK